MKNEPTIIDNSGTKKWLAGGLFHRVDGPALEYEDGEKSWYFHGMRHREDGPAIMWTDQIEWFLDDTQYSKPDYYQELFKRGLIGEDELFLELI